MAKVTANQVYKKLFAFEQELLQARFNLNDYEGAPKYVQDKLQYFNVKLAQLAYSVGQAREQLPSKFRHEKGG